MGKFGVFDNRNSLELQHLSDPIYQKDYPCIALGRWFCSFPHPKEFRIRCRQYSTCSHCRIWRYKKVLKIGTLRWENSIYFRFSEPLVLWTLGTNWFDTKSNRKKLSVTWKSFRKKLWNHYKDRGWKYPQLLLRVFEAGSKGNMLHIHFLSEIGIPFRWILRYWRNITRLKANVNYSFPMRCLSCYRNPDLEKYLSPDKSVRCVHCKVVFTTQTRGSPVQTSKSENETSKNWDRLEGFYSFLYALKYCAKASGSYYWQGHILKAKPPKQELVGYCVWKNCLLPLDKVELNYNPWVVSI